MIINNRDEIKRPKILSMTNKIFTHTHTHTHTHIHTPHRLPIASNTKGENSAPRSTIYGINYPRNLEIKIYQLISLKRN